MALLQAVPYVDHMHRLRLDARSVHRRREPSFFYTRSLPRFSQNLCTQHGSDVYPWKATGTLKRTPLSPVPEGLSHADCAVLLKIRNSSDSSCMMHDQHQLLSQKHVTV